MDASATPPILNLEKVCKAYGKASGGPLAVLQDVSLSIREGEILGLLGRSGAGKSTLLRIAGGLVEPTSGTVTYMGAPLRGPAQGIAMVFQTFALYPWLTVVENVALGLDALELPDAEAGRRAQAAIELIGLDGFESAYPRELSGGMRQRVGFARALVSDPRLLLMDEPFSALDVLTAETLRTDFLDLWIGRRIPTKAVLMVTHNIEEAVLMCDRILVLGSNPGRIAAEIRVPLPQPRERLEQPFRAIVDQIYAIQTTRIAAAIDSGGPARGGAAQVLPHVGVARIGAFAEALAGPAYNGQADLAVMAQALSLSTNDILQVATALHILEFAEMREGALRLTAAGRVFAESGGDERKRIFREHLLRFVPLASHMRAVLEERQSHRAPRQRFEEELEDFLHQDDVERTLEAVIDWGRYAEIFTYDDQAGTFDLDESSVSGAA